MEHNNLQSHQLVDIDLNDYAEGDIFVPPNQLWFPQKPANWLKIPNYNDYYIYPLEI